MDILRVENLCKVYGKGDTAVRALDNVSFTIQKGGFRRHRRPVRFRQIHPSAHSGRVDTPSSGKVYIDNTDVYSLSETNLAIFRRRQIGLIYQFFNLVPVLNVEENITLPLLLDGRKVDKAFLNDLTGTLGLRERLGHLPNQPRAASSSGSPSAGRSSTAPPLVLADEPTGNLDSKNSAEIIGLLKLYNKKYNQTLIVITHDEKIALQADRIHRASRTAASPGTR